MLNSTSCVQSTCERYNFDGDTDNDWMIRQFLLWDQHTVMIYDVGDKSTDDFKYPAYTIQEIAVEKGMGYLVNELMTRICDVTKLDIPNPDWAHLLLQP